MMTKVQIRFRLARPIDSVLMARISEANSRYGIFKVEVAPSHDAIMVEYDATRLRPAEVESALAAAGIPIAPEMA
jgi:allophanate hydrolase subunit 1